MEIRKKIKFLEGTADVKLSITNSQEGIVEVCVQHDNPSTVFNHLFQRASSPDYAVEKLLSKMMFTMFDLNSKGIVDVCKFESIYVQDIGALLHIHTKIKVETPIEIQFSANNKVSEMLSECNIQTQDHVG